MDADVIVVGGGAAGLAAARRLGAHGLRVVLLEGRDRIGGRAWSHPTRRAATPAELGAEFIHGPARETLALLREAGAAAIDPGGETWVLADGGLRRGESGDFASAARIFKAVESLDADESVDRFLQRFEGDGTMRDAVCAARSFAQGFDAADTAVASARAIADEWQSGVDDALARPLGGYRPLFAHLAAACDAAGVRTSLTTPVRRIAWQHADVTVTVRPAGAAEHALRARAAIVTLPVGVLRHAGNGTEVAFEPELPAAKRASLQMLETGDAVRVVLSFRSAFWETIRGGRYRNASFFRSLGNSFTAFWTQMPVRTELVTAWAGGPNATALSALPQAELIERAVEGFAALFAEDGAVARREFEEAFVHDWKRDPFARGAYSYVRVGGCDARAGLAEPLAATLFFAGEATSADGQGGTVNGALASGERAANEALEALGVPAR